MKSSFIRNLNFTLILAGIVFLFYGCAALSATDMSTTSSDEPNFAEEEQSGTEIETNKDKSSTAPYRFTDVPVPSKFKLDRKRSFIYESGSIKAGFIIYTGWASLDALVDFYKTEMLTYDWELVSIFEHTDVGMVFAKEGWNCSVRLTSRSLGGSKIEIQIGPISAL